MAAISNATHLAFLNLVKEELSKAGPCMMVESMKQEALIKEHVEEMEQLRADYLYHLKAIHAAIHKYETIKRETRVVLRKRLAASKRKITKETATLNHSI